MLFNSWQFAIFFIIVYSFYIRLNHKWQNRMLLVASYVFYGAWDWRFLSLLFISTVLDYFCGIKIYAAENAKKRKLFMYLSIFGNLSILGFFKYFNFFTASLEELLGFFGFSIHPNFFHFILPVGISFYTFQTMSYTIDIYRREMEPTHKFLDFALFVSFFPQLVAGPIERAKHLLPQILSPRKLTIDKFYEGSYLIFFGLFQKVFVADTLAKIVDPVFAGAPPYDGVKALFAVYAFAFMVFCDFAGYSNIARGLGKCMGFDIMVNFNLPYFSTNPREFWQRWHISLSTWLRDYLYIPLGGNRRGSLITCRNLAITMLLGGLWHGAGWTFVIWGVYQGLLLIVYRLIQPFLKKIHPPKSILLGRVWFFIRIIFFFHLICLGMLMFRAQSVNQIFGILHSILFGSVHWREAFFFVNMGAMLKILLQSIWLLLLIQIFQYIKNDLLVIFKWPAFAKGFVYALIFYYITFLGEYNGLEFVYFQF